MTLVVARRPWCYEKVKVEKVEQVVETFITVGSKRTEKELPRLDSQNHPHSCRLHQGTQLHTRIRQSKGLRLPTRRISKRFRPLYSSDLLSPVLFLTHSVTGSTQGIRDYRFRTYIGRSMLFLQGAKME